MALPAGWNVDDAIQACLPAARWRGRAWRAHRRDYAATDDTGARHYSGRYHRAIDRFPPESTWSALYLALGPEICLAEVLRHIRPERLPMLNDYSITEIDARLSYVLDLRDMSRLKLATDALAEDFDYELPQSLADAARRHGVQAIVVPSATRLGDNIIVFPDRLQTRSRLRVVNSRSPQLYVER